MKVIITVKTNDNQVFIIVPQAHSLKPCKTRSKGELGLTQHEIEANLTNVLDISVYLSVP